MTDIESWLRAAMASARLARMIAEMDDCSVRRLSQRRTREHVRRAAP